jgi:hypothetical protein
MTRMATKEELSRDVNTVKYYLDYHLMCLHDAITSGNEEVQAVQKEMLSTIREALIDLGYFPNPRPSN